MTDAAIATPEPTPEQAPAWYPWPELAPSLEALATERASLDAQAARVVRETAATIDALLAETDLAFQRVRQAYQSTYELGEEQAARLLRKIREQATVELRRSGEIPKVVLP